MLQLRSLAVGREGELAAAPGERLEHFTHPVKGFDGVEVFGLVDMCLVMQDLLAHGLVEVRRDNLQGLVPVEAQWSCKAAYGISTPASSSAS